MRSSRTRRLRLACGAVAVGSAFALATVIPSASAATGRHILAGTAPGWITKAQPLATLPSSSAVSFGILLKMRNEPAAVAQLQALSDPDSASYGNWLTNTAFDAEYAPAASDVSAVKSWLGKEGFSVTSTLRSGMLIEVAGSAAQIESTFGTSLEDYNLAGKTVRGNTTALSLPADTPATVAAAIDSVVGVDQGSTLKTPADTLPGPPAGSRYGVQPCSAYYDQKVATNQPTAYGKPQPYAVCGYTPQQYQSAYGESSLLDRGVNGRGVTVAITDAYAAPTMLEDAQIYNEVHHTPLFAPGQYSQITPSANGYGLVGPNDCDAQGWYGEETLDVEAVHAMAPGAKIVYVGGADCDTGLDDAWASTIDNHVADIITNSWTDGVDDVADLGQDYIDFYQQFSLEAALTGITVNFSSGDDGDHTAGGTALADKTVEFPADLPFVTGVGGTSVLINSRGQWQGEYGWSSAYSQLNAKDTAWGPLPGTYSSGGGGGTSMLFDQPFYQRGAVPKSIADVYGSTPMRAVPDIAMPADPNTGFEVGETQVFPDGTYWAQYRIGGTSLASPLMAGVIAVADQRAGHALGFVNPLYYKLIGSSGLHDIVAPKHPVAQVRTDYVNYLDNSQGKHYELQTIDVQSSTLHDTKGYDDETGVGTPSGPAFFDDLAFLSRLHR